MKAKNKLVVRNISIKKRSQNCVVLIKKRHFKGEKHIAPMDFAEYYRKSDVSQKSKAYYRRFLQNGLNERCCLLVQVDEMCNMWSLLVIVYWSRDEGDIRWSKFLLESSLEYPSTYYLLLSIFKGQASSRKRYNYRESLILQYGWNWSALI